MTLLDMSRTMRVKVGNVLSDPRLVLGGVPRGDLLGVYLFNFAIDNFVVHSTVGANYNPLEG